MGYYTRYSLTADPASLNAEAPLGTMVTEAHLLAEAARDLMVPYTVDVVAAVTEILEGGHGDPFEEPCKWYENEKDMRAASLRFPGVLLTLEGEGEEPGDMWRKHFRDGRMQECKAVVTYPEFDEAKLK
jgi:hypothetical protein